MLSDFFLHVSDLLSVAYKITQSVQEGLTYLHTHNMTLFPIFIFPPFLNIS